MSLSLLITILIGLTFLVLAYPRCPGKVIFYTAESDDVVLIFGLSANLKGPYFQPSLSVCLCVSLSLAGTSALQRWLILMKLGHKTLLWSLLAVTIMVQIGCRGTVWHLFENLKKFSKITEFKFQNFGPSFFVSVSPVYCKKIWLDSKKTDGGDRFWSLLLYRFRQWHCCSSMTVGGIFWLNQQRGGVQRSKLGRLELWAQSGRKNQPACFWHLFLFVFFVDFVAWFCIVNLVVVHYAV